MMITHIRAAARPRSRCLALKIAAVCVLGLAALDGSAIADTNIPPERRPTPPQGTATRLTITPDATSKIVVKVIPNAICKVMPAAATDRSQRYHRLYSDPDGTIEFYAKPAGASEGNLRLMIQCTAGKTTIEYPVDLRSNSAPNPDMPAPPPYQQKPPQGKALSPLTPQEAEQLSDEEIAKRGFPPRPDREATPGPYQAWLSAVTKPLLMIAPQIIRSPDVRHNATSNNWSGMELRGAGGPFAWVSGMWTVPAVSAPATPFVTGYSSMWGRARRRWNERSRPSGDRAGSHAICVSNLRHPLSANDHLLLRLDRVSPAATDRIRGVEFRRPSRGPDFHGGICRRGRR